MQTAAAVTIRHPWPDELPRVRHYLPGIFLYDSKPLLSIAVKGRVERIVGVVSLTMEPLKAQSEGVFGFRVEPMDGSDELLRSLIAEGAAAAWQAGAARITAAQTVEERSPEAATFRALGFGVEAVHEIYEADTAFVRERIARIYERMCASGVIPDGVELITLQPALIPTVQKFIFEHMRASASLLAIESAGYKPEHSIALLVKGEVKGVSLMRRIGKIGITGLRLVAPELRGGIPWANTLLLHESVSGGFGAGVERSRFELNPELHHDTKRFAASNGAALVGRQLLFSLENPDKLA